jgi:hypothetical protein
MTYEERNELRIHLLKELYKKCFERGSLKVSVLPDFDDNEKRLAYFYLEQKGLIILETKVASGERFIQAYAYITARGIDVVETDSPLR